jgi:twinkle protein
MQDLANRLGRGRCRWVSYPRDCKDANDVLLKYGAARLAEIVGKAEWMKIHGMYTLDQLPPEPKEEIHTIGIPGLDDFWKISRGRMTVITGIPGHGKSQAVTDAVCHLADQGFVVSIASFEDTPRGSLLDRLLRWRLRKDPEYAPQNEYDRAMDWVRQRFIFIYPDDESDETPTVDWYLERVQAAVIRHNVSVALVDPWNEIDHTIRNLDVAATEYVGFMLAKMRRHARTFRYHTMVVCHPKKMETGKDGKYRIPTGYDCADSAHFYNKPDVGITVYREESEEDGSFTRIGCWKAKLEGKIGVKGGKMTFRFNLHSGRYQAAPELLNSKAA